MKSLHNINSLSFPIPVTDMLLANLWYIIYHNYGRPRGYEGVRINLENYDPSPNYSFDLSPIERLDDTLGWDTWYWESERLGEWKIAGSLQVDLNRIMIVNETPA